MKQKIIVNLSIWTLVSFAGCTIAPDAKVAKHELIRNTDINSLEDQDASLKERRNSLLRLAAIRDPKGLEQAQKLVTSTRVFDRESAAMSLRYYANTAEAQSALATLAKDAETSVRSSALMSLNALGKNEKVEALAKELLTKAPVSVERIEILGLLHRATKNTGMQTQIETELLKYLKSSDTKLAMASLQMMARVSRNNAEFVKQLQAFLHKPENITLYQMAFRFLAMQNDSSLGTEIPKTLKSSDPNLRRVGVNALFRVCSENRWELLKELAQHEDNFSVLETILMTVKPMGGRKSADIADALKAKVTPGKTLALPAATDLAAWKQRDDRDMCSQKALALQHQNSQGQGPMLPGMAPGQGGMPSGPMTPQRMAQEQQMRRQNTMRPGMPMQPGARPGMPMQPGARPGMPPRPGMPTPRGARPGAQPRTTPNSSAPTDTSGQ